MIHRINDPYRGSGFQDRQIAPRALYLKPNGDYVSHQPMSKSLFHAIDLSAQGLSVQRTRMNTVSENIANVDTTKTEEGGPYRRKIVQVASGNHDDKFVDVLQKNQLKMVHTKDGHYPDEPFKAKAEDPKFGVHVCDIVPDPSAFRLVYDPAHPDANHEGYVEMPNINPVQEMIDLISASRSYEANVTSLNNSKEMIKNALRI